MGMGAPVPTTTPPSTFTADNDAPVITNLGSDNLAYTEGDGAVVIDQSTAAAVSDVDSSNFDTGTLTVAFTAGSRTVPRMKWLFATRGSGPGRLASVARNVTYAGTTIGTFTGGTGGTDLVITLNTNADATAVSALVQNITYENTDTSQPHAGHPHRPLCAHRWGWGHQRVTTTPPSTFTADNDAPVITNLGSDNLAYTEGDGAVVIDQSTAAAVSDVD